MHNSFFPRYTIRCQSKPAVVEMKIYAGIFKSHSRSRSRSAPVNQDLVLQDGNCGMILALLWALETAQNHFE